MFHESAIGQYLHKLPDAKLVEVYADPGISSSTLSKNELFLPVEEKYGALSLKTHKMMDFCVNNFEFQYLLKIDVTTIMTHFDGAEYEGRNPIDLDELLLFLKKLPCDEDYNGFSLHRHATRNGAESWAAKKGKLISYEKIFGDNNMPPFFSGKCYIVSHRFARFVSENGQEMAQEHEKYFLGAEDLMIGRMYAKFQKLMS